MEYLKQLNPEQLEAATTTEGFIRVVAGAGSGKTKTLTARYMYLVEMLGISTANILCVTFTNKAAAEMKKRIRRQLPDQDLNTDVTPCIHGQSTEKITHPLPHKKFPAPVIDQHGGAHGKHQSTPLPPPEMLLENK